MPRDIKKAVRDRYAKIATANNGGKTSGCGCCGGADSAAKISKCLGYSEKEIADVPEGANMGLGCGNPIVFSGMKAGDRVLDLGSGGGFDCFIAARKVGKKGFVVGVDMTHEMLEKARNNAKIGKYDNVEFRLGEIEHLPAGDNTFDCVISNCVINLSTDKVQVFREAYRVLKPGGKLVVSDIVLNGALPKAIKRSLAAYTGCIAGALQKEDYLDAVKKAGLSDVKILKESVYSFVDDLDSGDAKILMKEFGLTKKELEKAARAIVSITVEGTKRR